MAAGKAQTPAFNPSAQSLLRQRRMQARATSTRCTPRGQVSRPERDRGSTACRQRGRVRRRLLAPAPREPGFQTLRRQCVHGHQVQDEGRKRHPAAVYFEMLTQETLSSSQGGLLGAEGNYSDIAVGLHNNRGQLLNPPWTPNAISSSYQTFTVPFGTLVPRWVPLTSAGPYHSVCPTSGTPKCQAPAFNPRDVSRFPDFDLPGRGLPQARRINAWNL